jgi:hypothetical protein
MNSNGRAAFGQFWRGLEPPRHLHLFSRKCLRDKIAEIGFVDIRDCFSSFATAAMWRESQAIMAKAGFPTRHKYSFVGRLWAEIRAIFAPESREFITLVCVKK